MEQVEWVENIIVNTEIQKLLSIWSLDWRARTAINWNYTNASSNEKEIIKCHKGYSWIWKNSEKLAKTIVEVHDCQEKKEERLNASFAIDNIS